MEGFGMKACQLPPGFRFHPTDQELVIHYLKKKVTSSSTPVTSIIADVDIYKYNPWELSDKAFFGEGEWFFFSPRDRKYPNGDRPNRTAASGYWKATGTDKPILVSGGSKCLGVKKGLVFYKGRPSKGVKTDWVMQEYRLFDSTHPSSSSQKHKDSMRLDDWVLCRVRQKGSIAPTRQPTGEQREAICTINYPRHGIDQIVSEEKATGELYDWSDSQLLSYLLSSQQEGGESNSHNSAYTDSSPLLINSNISFQGCGAAADQLQVAPQAVSSMLESIKRKLSFGALDELVLQRPSKRPCYRVGDDQLSPTGSFSVDQVFSRF